MKIRIFIFLFIFLSGYLMSCNSTPVAHSPDKAENNPAQAGSKQIGDKKPQKLSSVLYELALAPDTEHFAKKHNIPLENNRVRVYIFLEPLSPDPERKKVFEDHKIMIEKRSGDMVRGLVAIDQLIPLSEEPVIRFIRLPDRLIKTRNLRQ
jgi:hypothetical protein